MRRYIFFSVIVAILAACTPKQVDPAITFADGKTPEIEVSSSASTSSVKFNSAIEWRAVSSEAWISVSPALGGSGDATVSISLSENSAKESREGNVTISSGSISKIIKVRQEATQAIDVSGNIVSVPYTGGTFKLGVGHNVELKVGTSANWLIYDNVKSYITDSLTFTVLASEVNNERTASISISSKDNKINRSVTVKQAAAPVKEISIKELASKATETESTFKFKFKNATVSFHLDVFCHIEDSTGAILYTNSNAESAIKTLVDGSVINGEVTGKIKLNGKVPQITSLDITSATVSSTQTVPITKISIAELNADYDKYLSRRLLIQGISVTKSIQGGTALERKGTISDGQNSIQIYSAYAKDPAVIQEGLKGELICYPSYSGTYKQLNVYRTSDFEEALQPAEETAFTAIKVPGIYNISNPSSPSAIYIPGEMDQTVMMSYSNARLCHMCSLSGSYAVMLKFNSAKLSNGMITTGSVDKTGSAAVLNPVTTGTINVVVAKKSGKMVWIRTQDSTAGYIISIE